MKHFFPIFFVAILLLITSCGSDGDNCVEGQTFNDWELLSLNNADLSIQVPTDYVGPGLFVFEGPIFQKFSPDSSITISVSFCGPLFCESYGQVFSSELINEESIEHTMYDEGQKILNEKICFTDGSESIGVLFYGEHNSEEFLGIYFSLHENNWWETVHVTFEKTKLEDVIDILSTISSS